MWTGRVVAVVGNFMKTGPLNEGLMAAKDTEVFPAPEADATILATFSVVSGFGTVQSALGPVQWKYPVVIVVGMAAWAGCSAISDTPTITFINASAKLGEVPQPHLIPSGDEEGLFTSMELLDRGDVLNGCEGLRNTIICNELLRHTLDVQPPTVFDLWGLACENSSRGYFDLKGASDARV
jgi:hypothetical protein